MRLTAPAWIIVGLFVLNGPAPAEEAPRPTNIVFILADDLGWTDLGCCGSRYYETPHIDRLAGQGVRFTCCYTAGPNCQPTRAALMSGQYGPRTGVYTVGTGARGLAELRKLQPVENVTKLPLDRVTVADALKARGYATGMFGKWHLGQDPDHHPGKRGFDSAIESMGKHFAFRTSPPTPTRPNEYLADFLTDQALAFIDRNKDRHFFLYLPHFGVHVPHEAKAELIARFKDRPAAGGHKDPVYAAMIASLDESVGRIMARLDELKLADRTVVLFSSDNGGVGGYAEMGLKARDHTSNAPLRGGKGTLYEGGVRVPLLVRWPGVTPPGKVCDEPVISVDFYPTFLDIAGGKADPRVTLDGVSFRPLLSAPEAKLGREALYWHFPGYLEGGPRDWRTTPAGAIRAGDFKLLEFFETGKRELYNLKDDLGQKHDLAAAQPEKVKELHQKLVAWRQAIKAPMPTPRKP
jgi:arylsulfatase A-like enzyme